jgi:guanylate kinase
MHRSIAFSWKRLNFSIFNAANFFFVRRAMTTQVDQLAEKQVYRPLVITGPSGAGKGTIIALLLKEFPNKFSRAVTHTTRAPRPGETNGVSYHFTQRDVMEKEVEAGKFIESAIIHGNMYGTSIRAVEAVAEQGKVCIMEIDVQGCESVKKTHLNPRYVFIAPPSMEVLEQRLRGRGTETEDVVLIRLNTARAEMVYMDKPGFFDKVIVNDNLDRALNELKEYLKNDLANL